MWKQQMNMIEWIQKHKENLRSLCDMLIGVSLGLLLTVLLTRLGVPLGIWNTLTTNYATNAEK